jgi:hypothetical protein
MPSESDAVLRLYWWTPKLPDRLTVVPKSFRIAWLNAAAAERSNTGKT